MVDRQRAARAIEEFLRALGHEPVGELAQTGERVADAWADDLLEGEFVDPVTIVREGTLPIDPLEPASQQLVVVRDLNVATMCPHHLLPAVGKGTVAFLPGDKLIGLGTVAHVLDILSRRLTLQEQIGSGMVDLLMRELGVKGVLCKLSLSHTCLTIRGERKGGTLLETLNVGGVFAAHTQERELALAVLRGA